MAVKLFIPLFFTPTTRTETPGIKTAFRDFFPAPLLQYGWIVSKNKKIDY